jgi:hypothetical protein
MALGPSAGLDAVKRNVVAFAVELQKGFTMTHETTIPPWGRN